MQRFARQGGEGEMRAVLAAMSVSQEPVLDGLHRILSFMIDAEDDPRDERPRERRMAKPPGAARRPAEGALLRLIGAPQLRSSAA